MEITDRKEKEAMELFNNQVEESKKNLESIEKSLKNKLD